MKVWFIEGNPRDIDNMTTNFSLTASGCRKLPFSALGESVPSNFDIVIPETSLCEGMVVY